MAKTPATQWDTIVVGAGVFGVWTAWHLRERGQRVLLLDAHGPAHARASSGDRRSGSVTISISGTPDRLKSTSE